MNHRHFVPATAMALALSVSAWAQPKTLPGAEAAIARLLADSNGVARISLSEATGTARFVRLGPGSGGAVEGLGARRERSQEFLAQRGGVFGIRDSAAELVEAKVDADASGGTHITYHQSYRGLPVFAGVMKAHFNPNGELTAINGTFIPEIDLNPTPSRSVQAASRVAVSKVQRDLGRTGLSARRTELLVFREGLAKGVAGPNHLAWEVEVGNGGDVREFVFIDAHSGNFIEQFTGIHDALNRRAFDGQNNVNPTPPNYPATPFWLEGSVAPGVLFFPTGTPEADNMIYASKETYDLYQNAFLRDSFDGAGATMDAIFNRGNACPNASWNGAFISFCPGLTSDDVTGHEWSHAYTEYTHNLIYQWQPGALNESYSDIFGETVDRINGRGLDAPFTGRTAGACSMFSPGAGTDNSYRWLLGEEDTGALAGALRDMWNPTCYGDPGKVSDTQYACSTADQGGVHTNSGVPNHAYALLVDGGTYNSQTVTAIGLTKAAHIYFRAESVYQGPASDFADHADALEASCSDLRVAGTNLADLSTGSPSGQILTVSDCAQVATAILAVQLRTPPTQCSFVPLLAPNPPDRCAPGATQTTALFEDFEIGSSGWTTSNLFTGTGFTPRNWLLTGGLPDSRPGQAFFASDPNSGTCSPGGDESGVLFLTSPSIVLPSGAAPLVTFDHWVATELDYDGGNVKVSVNGGPFTLVAQAHYTFNPYNVTALQATNPLQGQPGFSGSDGGSLSGSWGRSHVNLAPYASPGDTVQLRFDLGSDGCGGSFGWYIDDVSVHACVLTGPEIGVKGNGIDIVDGDSTPGLPDGTEFGIADISGGTVVRTFTVDNPGGSNLTLGSITIGGSNPGDFSVTLAPVSPVAPLGSTTFQITFDPGASGPRTATVSLANNDADENPFDFTIGGTGTAGSASCPRVVLPNNGGTSGNQRAPNTNHAFGRAVYLITAAELAAAGYPSGSSPTTIGWNYSTANVGGSAPLIVYLQNTADVTNLKSATWATAITGMTTVHNATTALPGVAGPFDIAFANGSPFTYTGGGLYVAFDWGQYIGTGISAKIGVVRCNTLLAGGLKGAQNDVSAPTTVASSNFRPETRLSGNFPPNVQNDAAVSTLISYGELPFGLASQSTRAIITNNGAATLINLPVTLNVTGANTFTNTQMIPSLAACGGQATVTFAAFTPGALGSDTVSASVPADDVPANDSQSKPLNTTSLNYSYKYPGSAASGGVGFNGATAAFVGKFTTTAAAAVASVKLEFASVTAVTYRVAIYGNNGGVPSTTALYVDAADRTVGAAGPVTIALPSPVPVPAGNFFVGIQQTNTTNASLSFDTEAPVRSGSLFLATPNPPAAWQDFSPGNSFKLNIGVILATVPGIPTIGAATVASGTVSVAFTAPGSDGGSPITGYTATCSGAGGPYTGAGGGSPILVTVPNGVAVTCTVHATNGVGSSPESSPSNTVTASSPAYTLTVSDATRVEGNSGTAALNFTVSRAVTGGLPVTFTATTVPGTATGGGVDYINLTSSSFTMTAAQLTKTVSVSIVGEVLDENNEQFQLTLVPVTPTATINGSAVSAAVNGNITDNDTATFTINDFSINEGPSGQMATWTVSQSVPSTQNTSVKFSVSGTATAADYGTFAPAVGTPLMFTASLTTPPPQTITVPITDDTLDEFNETLVVNLNTPTGGAVLGAGGAATGSVTIIDSPPDPQPVVTINSVSLAEGSPSGNTTFVFTLSLNIPSAKTINVTATTSDGTALISDNDYVAKTQGFTFTAGQLGPKSFSVTVKRDTATETDETFGVTLSGVTNATAGPAGVGTIVNDDSPPQLTIGDLSIDEGTGAGPTSFTFTVTRSSPLTGVVTFNIATNPLTATDVAGPSQDYTAVSLSGETFAANETTKTYTVLVNHDSAPEGHDKFTLDITGADYDLSPNNPADVSALGTIENDDAVAPGDLVISEFALRGNDGCEVGNIFEDEFVEIANRTAFPIGVGDMDDTSASGGFSVYQVGDVRLFTIPNGTIIPARGHYLAANPIGYGDCSGASTVPDTDLDSTWEALDAADNQGLALFDKRNPNIGGDTPLDAVGFAGDPAPYIEGATGLADLSPAPPSSDYSFVRRYFAGTGGGLQDGQPLVPLPPDSSLDWVLVNTAGSAPGVLGGPSPENTLSETEFTNAQLTMTSPEGNFITVPGTPNAIEFYRLMTNNTGLDLNALRFKVSFLATSGTLVLNPVTSGSATPTGPTYLGLALEESPPNYQNQAVDPITTLFTSLGGLNSTLRLNSFTFPLLGALPNPPGTVYVNFRALYSGSGSFAYWLVPQAK